MLADQLIIRRESPSDSDQIRIVTLAAFSGSPLGHHGEADLVEALLRACSEVLSLVAELENRVVGHVLFSPITIENGDALGDGMGLGPVAVLPELQGRGIGSALIKSGLKILGERDTSFVCVLGDPAFYARLGFQPAEPFGLDSEFGGASDGTFQVIWLGDQPATHNGAMVRYRPEFTSLGHDDARNDPVGQQNVTPAAAGTQFQLEPVNLQEKFGRFSDYWSPKVVGELNGQQVKLVKFQGEFVWHKHDHEDELFLVVKGRFRLEFRDHHVWLEEGEFLIVPRGIEHRPVAEEEVHVMLFEPPSTLNTGNRADERTLAKLDWI
jgi:predicted N-acetyltransferase YhbS/mannose-6-phosphate isomerase-like protein (cupin superfamily)